ncbi:MAG TPA: ribosome maturation factor RimP [Mycobacteriales bacterium]|nr:ribosome maturation factor RimP [Mycobacteriales bacterium]
MTPGTADREGLTALVERVVLAAGFDLEGVTVSPAGRRSLVRVIVDAERGVSLDEIAEVSRALSAALDEDDGIMGRASYVLEVTSPGVDRPLSQARHWRRAVGRLVRVPVTGPSGKTETVEGRVVRADDGGVLLVVDGQRREYRHGVLGEGRVQVEFTHLDAPTALDEEEYTP